MKNFYALLMVILICMSAEGQTLECDNLCEPGCESTTDFYAGILGGANFIQSKTNGGIKSNFQTGYVVAGFLGYRWCYGLHLEIEYAFRRNPLKSVHFFGRKFSIHGHFRSSSYMANLLWDIPLTTWSCNFWNIQPYIGGGIGYDTQKIHGGSENLIINQKKNHFAWQAVAGLDYPMFCNANISLEYEFHKGGFNYINNHTLGARFTYNFGL